MGDCGGGPLGGGGTSCNEPLGVNTNLSVITVCGGNLTGGGNPGGGTIGEFIAQLPGPMSA